MSRTARAIVIGLVFTLMLGAIGSRWDRHAGWTELIRFGAEFEPQRLPELAALPIRTMPGGGYDGQFYAQLAVAPDVRRADIQAALDNPPYRARRILLSAAAYVAGGGDAWRILQVYALINIVCWVLFAVLLLRLLAPLDHRRLAIWAASVLSIGVIDSVRLSLTDLPGLLAVTFAIWLVQRNARWSATLALAVSGLARETVLLSAGVLWDAPPTNAGTKRATHPVGGVSSRALVELALKGIVAAAPVVLWVVWLRLNLAGAGAVRAGQLEWPIAPLLRHLAHCIREIAAGNLDGRYSFGLIGALGLVYQAWFLLSRPQWHDLWWRAAAPFAVLLCFFGDDMWAGYWGAARAVLPLTLAFNLLIPRDRWFWLRLVGANLSVLHAVWRLLP